MAIYRNGIITKIVKLSHYEFPHLVQNRENISMQNMWCIEHVSNLHNWRATCFFRHVVVVIEIINFVLLYLIYVATKFKQVTFEQATKGPMAFKFFLRD